MTKREKQIQETINKDKFLMDLMDYIGTDCETDEDYFKHLLWAQGHIANTLLYFANDLYPTEQQI